MCGAQKSDETFMRREYANIFIIEYLAKETAYLIDNRNNYMDSLSNLFVAK